MLKRIFGMTLVSMLLIIISITVWYFNRPLPQSIDNQPLYNGISYSRIVDSDRPLIYHLITIDLTQPDITFFTTPADDITGYDYTARTTSAVLEEYDLQIAINGDFFDPWFSYTPFHYYPHVGDGVNARGIAIADGQIASDGYAPDVSETLYITNNNQVSFSVPDAPIQTAISGNLLFVENGAYTLTDNNSYLDNRHPRTALAVNETGEQLLIVVVDGRQPNYSEGASLPELAKIVLEHGGYTALNLDGGGSVTLVMADEYDNAHLLNSPIHSRIPLRERPVANHFGVYAVPLNP